MNSTPGGQRSFGLSRAFASVMKGTISIWLYDAAPGTVTLSASLITFNSAMPLGQPGYRFHIMVTDSDGGWYHAGNATLTPLQETTTVARAVGWHQLKMVFTTANVQLSIDGTQVGSFAGNFGFNSIFIFITGLASKPDATFYWDDFSLEAIPTN